MSIVTLPDAFLVSTCSLYNSVAQRVNASPFGGSEQAIDLLNDRWLMSCEIPARLIRDGAWVEAFIASMRGQTNTTMVHHFARPYPAGTVRGTLVLAATALQGASSLVISGCSPADGTLLTGDMLGVGGLLCMVASPCAAVAGVITVLLTGPLRAQQLSGAAVTLAKPSFQARLLDTSYVTYKPGYAAPVTFDFGEKP